MNQLEELFTPRPPTPARPLLGLTVLVVEDSRFACEALRLMCIKSGARIRRADSLMAARRHLRTYRPGAVIVDIGLPDGSGQELIEELANASPRVEVLLASSGDPDASRDAANAGADGFLAKPISSLASFQTAILDHLPDDRMPTGPRLLTDEEIEPDPVALRDDIVHIADLITDPADGTALDYVAQLLRSVAISSNDSDLLAASEDIKTRQLANTALRPALAKLATLLQMRLSQSSTIM